MRLSDLARNVRRRSQSLAVLALVVLSALTLSQCKMVDERLTGVANPFKSGPEKCIQDCDKESDRELRQESALYMANVAMCHGDATCLALEQIRHENRVAQIAQERETCLNGCHHQGAGIGGR